MPVVIVETWSGKTNQQKAKLIKGIAQAFEEIGVPKTDVTVIIHDVPKTSWGKRGEPAAT
ncbi:MAG: tautomerase family protein [Candidatus Bathyarchaeota archaeon]|nr:tautomerase family protein [Candidatus Bathyarchaeota archaeon]